MKQIRLVPPYEASELPDTGQVSSPMQTNLDPWYSVDIYRPSLHAEQVNSPMYTRLAHPGRPLLFFHTLCCCPHKPMLHCFLCSQHLSASITVIVNKREPIQLSVTPHTSHLPHCIQTWVWWFSGLVPMVPFTGSKPNTALLSNTSLINVRLRKAWQSGSLNISKCCLKTF